MPRPCLKEGGGGGGGRRWEAGKHTPKLISRKKKTRLVCGLLGAEELAPRGARGVCAESSELGVLPGDPGVQPALPGIYGIPPPGARSAGEVAAASQDSEFPSGARGARREEPAPASRGALAETCGRELRGERGRPGPRLKGLGGERGWSGRRTQRRAGVGSVATASDRVRVRIEGPLHLTAQRLGILSSG